MIRWTRLLLLLFVMSVGFSAAPALELRAQEGNGDDDADANGEDDAAPGRTADVLERALAYRDAYSGRDADALWDLITEESRQGFEEDLSDLKRAMRELPEDQRGQLMHGLSVSPNDLLELRSGRDYFSWLLSEVDDEHLELVGSLTIDARGVRFLSGDNEARLTWRAPDEAGREARNLARDMPRTAVFENDRWHFVVSSD